MLTPLEIDALLPRATPYRKNDGGSLFVLVRPSGVKSFEFRYKRGGEVRALILGTYGTQPGELSLKAARAERDRLKALIGAGQDPAAQRHSGAEGGGEASHSRDQAGGAHTEAEIVAEGFDKAEKPLGTRERGTLLTIIASLCKHWGIKLERGAAAKIAGITVESGTPVSDDTVGRVLEKILESRK